ncbi:MAG: DUF3122 domain-containing protein [Actinomycetota bacterium]
MWQRIRALIATVTVLNLLAIFLSLGVPLSAKAALLKTEEAPGQMLYQSRQTLRDRSGNPWQVVLFKRVESHAPPSLNLRLVGFPDLAEISHPQPLKIITNTAQTLTAADVFSQNAPAPNVGEYDLSKIFDQLPANDFLKLSIPLKTGHNLNLTIPPSSVLEWQQVAVSK